MAFDPFSMGGRGGAAPAPIGPQGGGYGAIGGALPFSGGGGTYQGAYDAALNFNKANYNQILSGYQQTAASQQQAQQGIQAGYNNLTTSVLGKIQGIDASQRQALQDQYAQQRGETSQQLINRGLGNSTVQQSVDRGLLYNLDKGNIALTNATQGLNAQYQSQLGSQALGYASQAQQQNTALAQNQLAWMNSVNAGYPDASAYMKLAQMKGMSGGGAGGFQGGVPGGGGTPIQGTGGGGYANNAAWGGSSGWGGYSAPRTSYNYGNSPSVVTPAASSGYEMAPMPTYGPYSSDASYGGVNTDYSGSSMSWPGQNPVQSINPPQGDGYDGGGSDYYSEE